MATSVRGSKRWYIWLPLCALFLFPFFDPRRPFRILHLDLLVLVAGFGASHFLFNKGEIGTSVPLVYPVLVYFLGRLLVAAFRPRRPAGHWSRSCRRPFWSWGSSCSGGSGSAST